MKDWAPLVGSAIVALATLLTLFFTVRQNNKALRLAGAQHVETLEMAERREWLQWKRTRLAGLCDELLSIAHEASSRINGARYWDLTDYQHHWIEESNRVSSIIDLRARIALIVGDELDTEISAVWDCLVEALNIAQRDQVGLTVRIPPTGFLNEVQQEMDTATKAVSASSRQFAVAARALLQAPTDRIDSPHSTEPSDPPTPEAPQDD